ncbi:hypothetical protein GCM10009000_058990 [Halobacterium noricense]|uniref:Transposase n=1 Tax=Haladaptatus pallidirubidus TaxID=1008152 RepID=A0AAV3UHH0_9EURY
MERRTQTHNALLRLSRHEEACRKQYIHTVANKIVVVAVEYDCDVIVFEELTNIREQLPYPEWYYVRALHCLFENKASDYGFETGQIESYVLILFAD